MSFINPSADPKVADVQTANVAANPVVEKSNEVQKPEERRYTGVEMEQIVKDRLTRERKKFEKEKVDWQKAASEPVATPEPKDKQVHPNIEQEFSRKLTDAEARNKALAEQLGKYREQTLSAQVERELVAQGCIDPEVVLDHFRSRKLVGLDDDGNMVVENTSGKLDDLVRDYLSQKPHLKRAESVGGLGTRGPKPVVGAVSEREQLLAQITASRNTGKLFGR